MHPTFVNNNVNNYVNNLVLFSRIAAVLTSLTLSIGLLIHRIFGVSIRNSELVWKELSLLLTRAATYKSGRYYEFYEGEYITNLQSLADELERDSFNPFNPQNIKYARTVREARQLAEDLRLQDMNTLLRRQPFGILIGGAPGTGKSMSAMKMGAHVLKLSGCEPTQKNMITLNEGDDFQSEFRTHHKCVIFDDLGATKTSITGQDPFRKVIDFINNVPRTSLNPHLELKGNVWIEPEVVVATTNLKIPFKSCQANNMESVMCHDALNRRFKLKIVQIDYDTYALAELATEKNSNIANPVTGRKMKWPELKDLLTKLYTEHAKGQETYLSLMQDIIPNGVRSDLRPESSGLGWYLVIAFQAAVRFFYYRCILAGNWSGDAIILLNIRRFLAVPLNQVRSEQRKLIMERLFEAGFSRRAISVMIDSRATVTRLISGIIPTAIEIILDVLHGRSYTDRVTGALAVWGFDGFIRCALPKVHSSIVYDMSVLILGSVFGRTFRASADGDGYANRYSSYFLDSLRNRTRSWGVFIGSLLAAFHPVVIFTHFTQQVTRLIDEITSAFRARGYKAEAKKIRRQELVPNEEIFSTRIFRYAFATGDFTRFEPLAPPDEISEPNLVQSKTFTRSLAVHAPLTLTTSGFMKTLGSSRYGDMQVSPMLTINKGGISPGNTFLIVYDRTLEALVIVIRPSMSETQRKWLLKRIAIPFERRRALNVALVEALSTHIKVLNIRHSQYSECHQLLLKCQYLHEVSALLLVRHDYVDGLLNSRKMVGYRDTNQRKVTVSEEIEINTQFNDSDEIEDRAVSIM